MSSKKVDWKEWIRTIIITVAVFLLLRIFIVMPIVVEGPSMEPTLQNSDRLIVEKVSKHFTDIQRFDVIVFHATSTRDYIKRVIGLPGETIAYRNDKLYVNDEFVEEPFLAEAKQHLAEEESYTTDFTLAEDVPGNYETIPEGYVFVLGDNRPDSTDSRRLGLIPIEQVVGQALFTYWPINSWQWIE
ncbi:signal peptidase I [Gracilibacillus halophilus YIM-C55.5]|uniref:Signal peptidase I n=1 Tax=Gracilibacillus halophilus YIM-C55.5 TaxID=1308866 RepID=N4WG54_9BACI|nr:signal peptidase I [Gracilibacillus halophilus]ENH98259.1 signal peptidase I [Gracilibacillus halophilus YIM-C55.5]